MSTEIILALCTILLVSYVFDLTSKKTRVPSVILLLLMGWLIKQATHFFGILVPDLTDLLPILGTVGLVLIVLEGSMDLEMDEQSFPLIKKSFYMAFVPFTIMAIILAFAFHEFGHYPFRESLINALPFCIISSAIAIPSVQNWSKNDKGFITYESSLSDIIGVVIFNFIALNTTFSAGTFGYFLLEIVAILVISILATLGLSLLLSRLNHHIKFGPILILVVLIYTITKIYHLPGLIFIMIFGLTLANIKEIIAKSKINILKLDHISTEIQQFKDIVAEATFLIRTMFFIVFGYLIELNEVINPETIGWALGIVVVLLLLRVTMLKLLRLKVFPLMFVAPRGLITILLFFSILLEDRIHFVNQSLIIQVILLTILVMMVGLIFTKSSSKETPEEFSASDEMKTEE